MEGEALTYFFSRPLIRAGLVFLVYLTCSPPSALAQALPDPPGAYFPVTATETAQIATYCPGDRLVATYLFYWYKWADACAGSVCEPVYYRSHILFATGFNNSLQPVDALTDHPPDIQTWSYEDPLWFSKQFDQLLSAGIDLVLPVFWGVPGRYGEGGHSVAAWSALGMKALVTALETREKEGKPNPRIGMMYDTSTLSFESPYNPHQGNKIDLRTEAGKTHFYVTIRDFYSLLPSKYWALWERKPLIWLYASEWASAHDETVLPYARMRFAQDFGGLTPLFVGHTDWSPASGVDWIYQWGGSIKPTYLSVNSVGPGFDNSAVFGKPQGSCILRQRDNGNFYRQAWERALRTETPITVIETWNELHEGTEICPTEEWGHEYLDITREYVKAFKKSSESQPLLCGERLGASPHLPGPYQDARSISWSAETKEKGIQPLPAEDGTFRFIPTHEGQVIEMTSHYLYLSIDDSFCFNTREPLSLEVEYFNVPVSETIGGTTGSFHVEYDSWDRNAVFHGMYKTTETCSIEKKLGWRSHRFALKEARLANNQNQNADLRIVAPRGLRIRKVVLMRE
jgi:hypothetical protein